MSELLASQRAFAAALRDADALAPAARWLDGSPELAAKRLAIYRANVGASIAKALRAAYPVIEQIVGIEFFEALAVAHRDAHPSTSGDLNDYGATLAAYLSQFPHTQHLPYLPDLARLEWAVHRAYGAADAQAFDATALAGLSAEQQAGLRFRWAQGTALVDSAHPIVRIWQIHQAGYEGEFSVEWQAAQCALIARSGWRVDVSVLDAGDAAFVAASLHENATLARATESASAAEPGFDLGRLLGRAVSANLITHAVVDEQVA
jgi:hypothetical protein